MEEPSIHSQDDWNVETPRWRTLPVGARKDYYYDDDKS
jgi:hypothetical protein